MWFYGPILPGSGQQQATAGPNNYTLTCQSGSFNLSGQSAVLTRTKLLIASSGSFTYTGKSAALVRGRVLTSQAGSFSLSGQSATIKRDRKLTASNGAFSYTGQQVTLLRSKLLVGQTGGFSLNGQQATITYTPGATNYTLTANGGSFTLSGQSASLSRNRSLTASNGSFSVSGQAVAIKRNRALSTQSGAYSLAGQNAVISYTGSANNYQLTCQSGSYHFGAGYVYDGYVEIGYSGEATITVGKAQEVNVWLGGGGSSLKRLDKRQTEEEKRIERESLGIIEKITPIIEEKAKVKAKKESVSSGSSDYFDLVAYEYLLNEQIAKIRADILLEKIKQRVISDNIAALIEESLNKRQAEIEMQQFLEYQRIIEEDLIFVFSMLAEM